MNVRPEQVSHREFYRILISSVAPRPIAWVSTLNKAGRPNLAPFSFFNVVSAMPPVLGFSPALRRLESGHEVKGTLVNIRDTKEFVVNIVTYEMAEAMNLSSGEYEYAVDEFELAKLATRASEVVRPPQVAISPVSFECKLYQIIDFGNQPPAGSFVMGEIVCAHIEEDVVTQGQLDPNALDLIGRMGGMQYARTTERFEMARPPVRR
jgi:flavin reductase (DIM6/NTAB) family NADH-FMN oxidoreductase RutF